MDIFHREFKPASDLGQPYLQATPGLLQMTEVRRAGSGCVQAPVGNAGGAAAPACSCIPDELGRKAAVSCGCVSAPPGRALPTCQVLLEYCCPSPFPATDTKIVDMMHTTTLSMGSVELLDAVLAYLPPPPNRVVPVAGGASGPCEMYMLGLVADKAVARLEQLPAPGPQASGGAGGRVGVEHHCGRTPSSWSAGRGHARAAC